MSKGGDNMNSNNLGSIEKKLLEDPQNSNRLIGAQLKVSDRTVAKVRKELEATSRIPVVTHTRGSDGRLRPRKHSRKAVQTKSTAPPEIFRTTRTRYRARGDCARRCPQCILKPPTCIHRSAAFRRLRPCRGLVSDTP